MIKIVGDKKSMTIEVEGFEKDIIKEMCFAIEAFNRRLREEDEMSAMVFQRAIIALQSDIFGEEQTKKVIEVMKKEK
jgi:hypothetical protein